MPSPDLPTVEELQAQNMDDLQKLAQGKYGKPIHLNPAQFEMLNLTLMVERLFEALAPEKLDEARFESAGVISAIISQAISASRQALITEGTQQTAQKLQSVK